MSDQFEYIECWVDDTIGKSPWSNSCPNGQNCKDSDDSDDSDVSDDKKKGLSKDAKLTVILCCTLIPLVLGGGIFLKRLLNNRGN